MSRSIRLHGLCSSLMLFSLSLCAATSSAQGTRSDPSDLHHPFNTPPAVSSPASSAEFRLWRSEIRRALRVPLPLPALDPHSFGAFQAMPGVIAHRVTYGTQFRMRIPAIVYAPEHPHGKVPAIVVVAGHGGDKTTWYSVYTGLLYAKAGAVVLTYDPIGEDERNAERRSDARAHDAIIPGSEAAILTGGLMITDILQAVSYVRSLPEVDVSRVTVAGYSMGSLQAVLAAAIDPRIRTLVLSGGGDLDGNGGAWESGGKQNCQVAPYRALNFLPDKAAILYALHQRVGTTLILNGRLDPLVGRPHHFESFFSDLADRVAAIAEPAATGLEFRFIPDASHRPSWMTLEAAEWMNAKLHFPNWIGSSLPDLGQTHIAEWAAQRGVHINNGYQDEEHEGGIHALGTGFPGIERNDLQVVPEREWKQHPDLYTWQSWQTHVLQTEGLPLSMAVEPPTPR